MPYICTECSTCAFMYFCSFVLLRYTCVLLLLVAGAKRHESTMKAPGHISQTTLYIYVHLFLPFIGKVLKGKKGFGSYKPCDLAIVFG